MSRVDPSGPPSLTRRHRPVVDVPPAPAQSAEPCAYMTDRPTDQQYHLSIHANSKTEKHTAESVTHTHTHTQKDPAKRNLSPTSVCDATLAACSRICRSDIVVPLSPVSCFTAPFSSGAYVYFRLSCDGLAHILCIRRLYLSRTRGTSSFRMQAL
ncbi:hypothetical protein LZ31DRAFT_223718 [Colletotrichum somersetense]|nr:hypothetical protein LZ31DRAFT_223718 [Colletotrichum somersetense]